MRVIGVLVAFEAERDFAANAARAAALVDRLIVVDNAPTGHPLAARVTATPNVELIANANRGALAGAYNAALAHIARAHAKATHVIWLDDDSDTSSLAEFLSDAQTRTFANDPAIAAVAPAYRDARTGLRGAHIQLRAWSWRTLPRESTAPTSVAFLINSMALWRLDALSRLGPFDEQLAIDHVDSDMCLRARRAGLALMLHGRFGFSHRIGERVSYRLLGKTLQSGGHSPQRRALIARNTVLIAKRHSRHTPAFAALCLARLVYEAVGVVLAEDNKGPKLRAIASGIWRGVLERPAPLVS